MEALENRPEIGKKRRLLLLGGAAVAAVAVVAGILVYHYGNVYKSLTSELGEALPEAAAFLRRGDGAEYLEVPEIDSHREGSYRLRLQTSGGKRTVTLQTKDTTPPAAEDAAEELLPGESIAPERAVRKLNDASDVTAEWQSAPDLTSSGVHNCSVLLRDAYGNESTVPATVTVAKIALAVDYVLGDALPEIGDFVSDWDGGAEIVTDLDGIDWTCPGSAEVELLVGGKTFVSTVNLLDRTPPQLVVAASAVTPGGQVQAEDFVVDCTDASDVEFSLEQTPDTGEKGVCPVTVVATDAAGNTSSCETELYVADAVAELEAERETIAGWRVISRFGEEWAGYYADNGNLMYVFDTPGVTLMEIRSWKDSATAAVRVRDTTPPAATPREDALCYLGYARDPLYFAESVEDATEVTARFLTEPDWNTESRQKVKVELRDSSGNTSELSCETDFVPDLEPPRIYAARDRYCYAGEAVAYFKEVFAEDNIDPDVILEVDKSKVNYRAAGEYPVTYTATDHDGNSTSVDVTFTFVEQTVSDEELDALAEEILEKILTDDMSVAEKAKAVYDYVYSNINYIGNSDKTNWKGEAYRGLTTHFGDCFTYYSSAYLLLSKIDGVELLSVERLNGWTRHYWLLVNLGTGWYHFDACRGAPDEARVFMRTTQQLQYLEQGSYYWRFDESLYPEVATKPFEMF